MAMVCERRRWVSEVNEVIVFLNCQARPAKRLQRLARDFGSETERGVRIDLRISQQELRNFTGATREAVNKVLNAW